jgi:hypothetical protein
MFHGQAETLTTFDGSPLDANEGDNNEGSAIDVMLKARKETLATEESLEVRRRRGGRHPVWCLCGAVWC